jgi:transcriptional regulator with GAF, ATPase, and Fis domain
MQRLTNYPWPGNIRELQNVIERAVILSPGNTLALAEELRAPALGVPDSAGRAAEKTAAGADGTPAQVGTPTPALEDVERRHIETVLTQTNWMIEGERGAANILKMNPSTLRSRMQKHGIKRPARVGLREFNPP